MLKYLNHKLDLLYGSLLCRRAYLVTSLTGSMTMFLKTVSEIETLSSSNVLSSDFKCLENPNMA